MAVATTRVSGRSGRGTGTPAAIVEAAGAAIVVAVIAIAVVDGAPRRGATGSRLECGHR